MQHGDVGQWQKWHFKHTKKVIRGVTQMAYGIQIDGVDNAFRVRFRFYRFMHFYLIQLYESFGYFVHQTVNQKEYFDKFAELNVFASGQPFCFQGNMKNELASSYIDLRPFLEMYLMGKEKQNDYDDQFDDVVSANQELLIEQRKALLKCNKKIDRMHQAYSKEKEYRQCQVLICCSCYLRFASNNHSHLHQQAENERDSWLLQLFYYHKYSEVLRDELNTLRQRIDGEDGLQGNELDQQIRQWVSK